MLLSLHDPSDLLWLDERIVREPKAKQRDRYRVVRLALEGQETLAIAGVVARSRKFVQAWVYRYRDYGRESLVPIRQPGRKPKLPPDQHERLKQRLDAGPRPEDKVCTLRGRDIRRIGSTPTTTTCYMPPTPPWPASTPTESKPFARVITSRLRINQDAYYIFYG